MKKKYISSVVLGLLLSSANGAGLNTWVNSASNVTSTGSVGQASNVVNSISSTTGLDLSGISSGLSIFSGNLTETFGVLQSSSAYLKNSKFGRAFDVCYGDGNLGNVPDINLNACGYINGLGGADMCGNLPTIPGVSKRTASTDGKKNELADYCNSFYKNDTQALNKSPVAVKNLKSKIVDLTPSDEDLTYKALTDTTTKKSVYKKEVVGVDSLSNISFFDKSTNTTKAPLKEIVNQENPTNKDAMNYYTRLAEKTSSSDSTEAAKEVKTAVYNAKNINVSYDNVDEYIDDRDKIAKRLVSLEEELLKYKETLSENVLSNLEDINKTNMNNTSARQSQTSALKQKLKKDYDTIVDKWIDIRVKYYHSFERDGFVNPTKDTVDRIAYSGDEAIIRAATVNKINRQVNKEARDIAEFHKEGLQMKDKFTTLLDKTIIMSQQFNEAAAKQSVGL